MTTQQIIKSIFTPADVKQVYSGIDGRCCCGCAGKHTTAEESQKTVKLMFNKIVASEEVELELGCVDSYIAAVEGQRLRVAYLNEQGNQKLVDYLSGL